METNALKVNKKQFSRIGLTMFLATLILNGVQILGAVIGAMIPAVANNGDLLFLASMLPMYVIGFPLVFLLFKRIPSHMEGEKKAMKLSHLLVAFLICYGCTYVCNLLATGLTAIIAAIKQSPVQHVMTAVTSGISPATNFLVLVICAPIMEELLFRKAIIDRTAHYGEGLSLLFSGLLFGLFHGNLVQFSYAFLIGMLFGFIYIKTRNILYPIALHVGINFLGSFVSSIILDVSGAMDIMSITDQAEMMSAIMENIGGMAIYGLYSLLIIGMTIAGIVLFIVNRKKFQVSSGAVVIEKGQRFKTIFLNLGMILYCIFWIAIIVIQLMA